MRCSRRSRATCRRRASPRHAGKLPDEDGTATRFERAFRRAGWIVLREACDTNHVLPVAGRSYAEYLAARPGPLRTTLKRKAKKVEVEILTSFDGDAWDAYEAVYAASWKPEEGDPALLRRFAEAEGAAGRLRLGLARHEGEVGRGAVLDRRGRRGVDPQARASRERQAAFGRHDAERGAVRARDRPRPGRAGSTSAPATIPTSATGWSRSARAGG